MRKSTCKCIEPSACQTKTFFLVLSAFASLFRSPAGEERCLNKGNGFSKAERKQNAVIALPKCQASVLALSWSCPGAIVIALVQAACLCLLSLHANGICLAASRRCLCLSACQAHSLSLSLFNISIINCNI